MKLSALVITKNEQQNIQACLESLCWANEIVVVDSMSTDGTIEIAQKYTDKVFTNPWPGYSNQKNFGHSKCQYEWILSIDADERVTPQLRREIEQAISQNTYVAYRVYIRDYMFGKWIEYGGWQAQHHIRLYRRDSATWESNVHESVKIRGQIGSLENPILHYSHLTIQRFVEKANRYTEIEAQDRFQQGIRKSWWTIIASAFWIFAYHYFFRSGFRDGGHGFVRSTLLAFYHFLARIKLWEFWYKYDHRIE
jgi:glycosyltransferase involved in cell wall biosynthesis